MNKSDSINYQKEQVRSAEKTVNRFISSFLYNFKYVFNIRKPIMMARVAHNLLSANLLRKPYPRTLDMNITMDCNLRCAHCFAEAFRTRKHERRSLEPKDYADIARQAIQIGFTSFNLQGGEPFINPDIFEIIRNIQPNKVWIACATNGTLTTREKLMEARKCGLDCIYVSIDSLDPEIHDKFRGGVEGTLNKALRTIDDAISLGIKTTISTTVTPKDIYGENFQDIIKFAKKKRMLVQLSLAVPAGKWKNQKDLLFDYNDTAHLMEILRKNNHVRTDMEANYLVWGCPSFKERLYITNLGDVLPCPYIHISFGNILEKPLNDIIKVGLENPWFKEYKPLCLASQDIDFIREYIYPTFDQPRLPVYHTVIFNEGNMAKTMSINN